MDIPWANGSLVDAVCVPSFFGQNMSFNEILTPVMGYSNVDVQSVIVSKDTFFNIISPE
jgi:hypothetical protein